MNISLAPLEGITTYIFRNALCRYYGGVDSFYTPFLTASHLKGRELRDVCPENNTGLNIIPQILTNDAELFFTIARQLQAIGYNEVNLNAGCPSGTVVSKGRGAGLLDEPSQLDRLLDEIFEKCKDLENMKISVKTRIGLDTLNQWEDILAVYNRYPLSQLIIHPRMREEFYKGKVHFDAFEEAVQMYGMGSGLEKQNTVLCYNGDITDSSSFEDVIERWKKAEKMEVSEEEKYSCEGKVIVEEVDSSVENDSDMKMCDYHVMIGRGLVACPELASNLQEGNDCDGHIRDKRKFKEFITEIMEGYLEEMSHEKQVVMKMKELWSYWATGLNLDKKQLKEIHKVSRLADYKNVVDMIWT